MKNNRILHITPFYHPVIGGVENVTKNVVERLAEIGYEAYVVTAAIDHQGRAITPSQEEMNKVHVYRLPIMFRYRFGSCLRGLRKLLLRLSPNIAHVHVFRHPHTVQVALPTHRDGARVILHSHSPFYPRSIVGSIQAFYYHLFDRLVAPKLLLLYDAIIAVTSHDREELIRRGAPPHKTLVIPNGVEEKYLNNNENPESFLEKYGLDGDIVLVLGRIHPHKNIESLIWATPKILKKCPNTKMVIAGSGQHHYEVELLRLTERLGVEKKVIFTGSLDENEKMQAYRASAIFVLPSLYEPFGITLLEAMASELPVIVASGGGQQEFVVNNLTGQYYRAGDPDDLASKVISLLNNKQRRSRLAENAHLHATQYSWTKIFQRYLGLYSATLRI